MRCTLTNQTEIARLESGFWGRQELQLSIPTPADQPRLIGFKGRLNWYVDELLDAELAAAELIASGERWVCLTFGQVVLKRWEAE